MIFSALPDDNNVHGEKVKKLDMFAHDMLFRAMDHGGHLCVMASEEEEDIIHIPDQIIKSGNMFSI